MQYGFVCQPVSDGSSVVAYEMLVRQIEGDRPSQSSTSVLQWAHQEIGRLREIDREALELAIAAAQNGIPHHVNISLETVGDYGYFAELGKVLLDGGNPNLIVLEISEAIDPTPEFTQRWIGQIKAMGFPVILDDFGHSHGNNRALNLLNPDGIKIDGEIVRHATEKRILKIIEKDLRFCQEQGLSCVAEHVANESIYRELVKLCDRLGFENLLYQGWYFGSGELCSAPAKKP